MIIPFTLNHEQVYVDVDNQVSLASVLRNTLSISTLQTSCHNHGCSSCLVIWENKLTNSCLIPIGVVSFTNVLTLEGFLGTPILDSIQKKLTQHNIALCPYCKGPRLLSIIDLLQQANKIDSNEYLNILKLVDCSCTSYDILCDTVKILISTRENYD